MIKGLISRPELMKFLCDNLGNKILSICSPDLVAGNVTGGMLPGWLLSRYMMLPYVYVRDSRKKGGHKEQVTGLGPHIPRDCHCLVVEELVNFAQTTINSANLLRSMAFRVTHAATILSYENPIAVESLQDNNLVLISLITLDDLLRVAEAEGLFSKRAIDDYRLFLQNPWQWQVLRGLDPISEGDAQ